MFFCFFGHHISQILIKGISWASRSKSPPLKNTYRHTQMQENVTSQISLRMKLKPTLDWSNVEIQSVNAHNFSSHFQASGTTTKAQAENIWIQHLCIGELRGYILPKEDKKLPPHLYPDSRALLLVSNSCLSIIPDSFPHISNPIKQKQPGKYSFRQITWVGILPWIIIDL